MTSQARPLRYSKYEKRHDEAYQVGWLIAILNKEQESELGLPGARRIADLMMKLQKIDQLVTMLQRCGESSSTDGGGRLVRGVKFDDPLYEAANRRGGKIRAEVNKTLSAYRWSPVIGFAGAELEPDDRPDFHRTSRTNYTENFAVWVLLAQFGAGHIERMKCCDECRNWFYARTDHQRFCSDSCRKKFASQSNEYRLKRRTYMRNYRQNEKVEEETSLTLVKKIKRR